MENNPTTNLGSDLNSKSLQETQSPSTSNPSNSTSKSTSTSNSTKDNLSKLFSIVSNRLKKRGTLKPGTYLRYIEYLKTKDIPVPDPKDSNDSNEAPVSRTSLEKHHIKPKHEGGTNEPENIIRIRVRDHILAHLLLFLEQGGRGNLAAYVFRKATQNTDLSERSRSTAMLNRATGRGFWDPKVQRQNGLRGGSKGGSKNTPAQQAARSAVGKKYGREVGLSNQSENLKEILKQTFVFQNRTAPEELFVVPPQRSVIDIARFLNKECEARNRNDLKLNLEAVDGAEFSVDCLRSKARLPIIGESKRVSCPKHWTINEGVLELFSEFLEFNRSRFWFLEFSSGICVAFFCNVLKTFVIL